MFNTKVVMTIASVLLGVFAIGLSFLPAEVAVQFNLDDSKSNNLFIQITGSLYFGFAMLNWMAKDTVIGGIYNRPVAIANFSHFLLGALALLKSVRSGDTNSLSLVVVAAIYSVFAIAFGYLAFAYSPVKTKSS